MRAIGLLSVCLLLSGAGCAKEEPARGETPILVVAERVSLQPRQVDIQAVGSARAQRSVQLHSEESGEVVSVGFRAGDFVRAGQTLVRLDARTQSLAVARAEVSVREARQLLDRYRRIEDTGALSESQIEAGETALAAAEVELNQAQVALAKRTIRAPFSGHVGFTDLDRGALLTPDRLIAQLDDRGVLFVDFAAPESVFGDVDQGRAIRVDPYAEPGRTIEARVHRIGSAIDLEQRTFPVRVAINNTGDRLRPGMSFRVEFKAEERELPAVPEAAIVWGSEGAYLWRVREGQARRAPLTLVSRREGIALVEADLRPGDLVISEGVQKVREGSPVRLTRTAAAPPITAKVSAPPESGPQGKAGDGGR